MKKATKKAKREPRDINELAFSIVESLTSEDKPADDDEPEKDAAAVELGRRGGLKGGKARSEKLSANQRRAIAEKAAKVRWSKPE